MMMTRLRLMFSAALAAVAIAASGVAATPAAAYPDSPASRFLELKNGQVRQWTYNSGNYSVYNLPLSPANPSQSSIRLVAGLDDNHFLAVSSGDHSLYLWSWGYNTWRATWMDGGWDNTRLITSLDSHTFLSVTYAGALMKWSLNPDNPAQITWFGQIGNGWGYARAIAGLGQYNGSARFVEVRSDTGQFREWQQPSPTAYPTIVATMNSGLGATRQLAGMGLTEFVEVDSAGLLLRWTPNANENVGGWVRDYQTGSGWGVDNPLG
ncbi:hypothetical protein R8Z50_30150 [Longispora sp. K20-0274]|uniref:hypothetical protein n=1 Tax=Longispora sp. K20-0274 TaxID=3088255 RepID=UPI00399BEDD2